MEYGSIEWLRALIDASGVRQAQIAEHLRRSSTWVSNVIQGSTDDPMARMQVAVGVNQIHREQVRRYDELARPPKRGQQEAEVSDEPEQA